MKKFALALSVIFLLVLASVIITGMDDACKWIFGRWVSTQDFSVISSVLLINAERENLRDKNN